MVNSEKEGFVGEDKIEGSDNVNQPTDEVSEESSVEVSSWGIEASGIGYTAPSSNSQGNRRSGSGSVFAERLRNLLRNEGDGEVSIQQNDREDSVLFWLQALDLHVVGACRADERLRPLLKLNVSSGVAEDRFLAHLSQHFEAPEVGMLARCLCIPLVSIRVGKVVKQGTLLCPTTTRGNLNLMILPTSDLHISFVGDDGCTERVATLSSISENLAVVIEEIPADNSGRSFLVKCKGGQVSYFWCSEKSKLLGIELLAKMKDLLKRKPCLAHLTGISESRLNCFAIHLRAYLLGDMQANPTVSSTPLRDTATDTPEMDQNRHALSASAKPSRSRHGGGQAVNVHSFYQGSLSPRSNSFKDGQARNISSIRSGAREKCRRRGENYLSTVDNQPTASTSMLQGSFSSASESDRPLEVSRLSSLSPLSFLESPGNSALPPSLSSLSLRLPTSQLPAAGSLFSPYYCWCPPSASTLQYTVTPSQLPISSTESLSLPPLSSLLSAARSSSALVPPKLPLCLADLPSLDYPPYLPDPMARIPFSVSSFLATSSSQQIPTFTPLMCDPIVHIPVIDVCSSGQGYLVSAGPAITTSIPPLHPLIPGTDSVLEKSARETLRLLISSTQANPHLMEVLPAVLTSTSGQYNMLVAGSRGFYSGTRDVDATASNSVTAMGLVSLPQGCPQDFNIENQQEESGGWEGSCCSDDQENASLQ